jgi:hypothetical protein
MAKLAERVPFKRLGIINDGEMLIEVAITKFAAIFQGKLPDITVVALPALFRLDRDLATAIEDTFIAQGGAAALDQPEAGPLTKDGDVGSSPAAGSVGTVYALAA